MPFVEGESLRDRLNREGQLPLERRSTSRRGRRRARATPTGRASSTATSSRRTSCSRAATPCVADFGIAQAISAAGAERLTGDRHGDRHAGVHEPGAGRGEATSMARSDLYSLGCVLYEMLAGHAPFSGSPQSIVAQHLTARPPPLSLPAKALPPDISGVIETSLAKDPVDRFPDAAAFTSALEAARSRRPTATRKPAVLLGLAILGLLGLTFYAGRRIPSAAVASGSVASGLNRRLTQLTFSEGLEEWPAWSPDGARLAYVAESGGYRHLFVRTLATGAERRITQQSRDDIQPAWAPDGQHLVFVRASTSGGRLEPSDINGVYNEGGDIWQVDLETGRETRLVQDGFNPAYAPVGGRLAFDATYAGGRRIWVADSGGRNPRQVTSDSSEAVVHSEPRWAPDGRRIVFRRVEKIKSDILTVDLDTRGMNRVTDDNVLDMDPVWAADGLHIYFASSRGGGLNLWRIRLPAAGTAAGSPEQLTTGAGDDIQPTLSPKGDRLAFAVRGVNSDLWRMPLNPTTGQPSGPPAPVVMTTRVESRGSWAPDGKSIAFNSDRLGEMNIWLRSLTDSTERQLTRGPGGDYQPNWSPDGQTLVFFSARSGNADIWAVTVADGKLTQLTHDPETDTNPFYSPDGKQIAFVSDRDGRAEIWTIGADGANPQRVTSIGVGGHFLRWTADGRSIVFRAETGAQIQIYSVSLRDGALTRLPDVASGAHMSFSPSRSFILDVKGHKALWIFPVNGRRPGQQIFAFPNPEIRIDYPAWSPDGGWVLFDRAAPKGGDLWLSEASR